MKFDTTTELLILFAALQLLDIYTTLRVLRAGGRELNPVMAWLMAHMGVPQALVAMKVIVVLTVIWASLWLLLLPLWVLVVLCVLYVAVVVNTMHVLRAMQP